MERQIEIPDGVEASVSGQSVTVKGPKGELSRAFSVPKISIKMASKTITISTDSERRMFTALCGTVWAHIRNMVKGVQEGYAYKLKAVYAHFPMTIKVNGNIFSVDNFLGEKFPRTVSLPEGVDVQVNADEVIITGADKELVGMSATRIEQLTRLSYRDRRVFQDGIFITSKDGKSA